MPAVGRVTINAIKEREEAVRRALGEERETLDYILERWLRGRHIDLPLDKVAPLLVKREEIEERVKQAVSKLAKHLHSGHGGVGIFSIVSQRRLYGTGKSQIASFIRQELEKMGVITRFLLVSYNKVMDGSFRYELQKCRGLSPAAVFVDEVDLVVSPKLGEGEQARVVEAFANDVIEYSEELSAHSEVRQALVLVLSHKALDAIERVARDRLGRRLSVPLVEVEVPLEEGDLYEVFTTASALAALYYEVKDSIKYALLRDFVNDYASSLWSGEELAGTPIGTVVSKALSLALKFSEGLARVEVEVEAVKKLLASLKADTWRGSAVEHMVKEILKMSVPRYSFEVEGLKAECIFAPEEFRASGSKSDAYYSIKLGALEIGKYLVEITTEKEISEDRRRRLEELRSYHPTVLVYFYEEEKQLEEARRIAEELDVDLLLLKLKLFKYPAALWRAAEKEARELVRILADTAGIANSVEALLRRRGAAAVYFWLAKQKGEQDVQTLAEAKKNTVDILKDVVSGFIKELGFSSGMQRRSRDTVHRSFKKALERFQSALVPMKTKVPLSFDVQTLVIGLETRLDDVLTEWDRNKLGRLTSKTFSKEKHWNDELALDIAMKVLEGALNDALASTR